MYKKILIPMALNHDLSPRSLDVAEALRAGAGEIIALHVYEAPEGSVSAFVDEGVVKAGFEGARQKLNEKLKDTPNVSPVIIAGHSARTIVDYAAKNGIDCIVLGSHKPGLADYFLGSTASRVVRHATCSVHVIR